MNNFLLSALGQLAGLRDLGLLDHVKYIGGISGGNWAVWNYIYAEPASENDDNDDTLLGPIFGPDRLDDNMLSITHLRCLRTKAESDAFLPLMVSALADGSSVGHAWVRCFWGSYLFKPKSMNLSPPPNLPSFLEHSFSRICYQSETIQSIYHAPVGIPSETPFAWTQSDVNTIKSRNPELLRRVFGF